MISIQSPPSPTVCRAPGLHAVSLAAGGVIRHQISLQAVAAGMAAGLPVLAARFLEKQAASPVSCEVFGACALHGVACLPETGGIPISWMDGRGADPARVAGVQMLAVSGAEVLPVTLGGKPAGCAWEDEDMSYCLLGDMRPAHATAPREEQAREVWQNIEDALQAAGFAFTDIVRTWFYNDRILDWYDVFNAVRTEYFHVHGVFDRMVPASTGIGVANPAGAALVARVLAVRPKHDRVSISAVASPLQCPAPAYGSSFSRAVEIATPEARWLHISGTASIEPGGKTAHPGDIRGQIDLSLDVVEAILRSRGMDWRDVSRAIAYYPDLSDRMVFAACADARNFPELPALHVQADICRDDLMFEIELDAVVARDEHNFGAAEAFQPSTLREGK